MKILSRILVALVVLLGIAFLVIQSRAQAAPKGKCQGKVHLIIALDDKGCPTKEPPQPKEEQLDKWLKMAGIGPDCYKLHIWEDHVKVKEKGNLAEIKCVAKEGGQPLKPRMMQPTGSGTTQHIWFNTSLAKETFEKQMQAAKPKPKK